jgi:uncharacterized protein YbjT (DUF2867 family)
MSNTSASTKRIIVTLSTGKQGSGVVRALAKRNEGSSLAYEILAVTRSTSSSKAQSLAKLPGVVMLESAYEPASIFEKAEKAGAGGDIYGAFSVQQSFDNPDGGLKGEVDQAKKMVDEAAKRNIKHFIYSSVDFGGQSVTSEWKRALVQKGFAIPWSYALLLAPLLYRHSPF